jgi:predicted glutamine amidotransferase
MCRMVGVVFRREFPMGSLIDLREVARTGEIPGEQSPGHKDGWGIVSFRNGSPLYVGRSSRSIFLDESFESARRDVARIPAPNILIAHARALSSGAATILNTHPFIIDGIALCHNGTVKNIKFETRQALKGETDSERLLARLVDRTEESGNLEESIKSLISEDIHSCEYTAAIMFISDGKKLFAYRDFSPGSSGEYYDLKMAMTPDSVAFFQETTMEYDGDASQIENGELVTVDLNLNVRREMIL